MTFILHTSRLNLRHFMAEEDAEPMYLLNLNPNVMRYTGDIAFESVESSKKFLVDYTKSQQNGLGRFAVELRDTNEIIGWCGLKYHKNENFVDLGYRFFEKHWGKGYATEASIASLGYGFNELGLNEIIARTSKENLASVRVIEKLGFKESQCFPKDQVCDRIFKLSKEDFLALSDQKKPKSS